MADQFQPRFVDLVRSYSTSSGTSDFAIGPAVNGYISFTDACGVGDQFYYTASSLDFPAEHEVGRGTINADGTVARDPIGGVKTDFSAGTITISLVAAAEWFEHAQALVGNNVKSFGAKGDADDQNQGTDDTAAIQAALDHVGANGGGTLFFPEGRYKVSACLKVPPFLVLRGAGRRASTIIGTHAGGGGATPAEDARNGSILYSEAPINTSTRVDLTIENLCLEGVNGDNQGAGFYQQSGVVVTLRNCEIDGALKWAVILDQSEEVLIDGSELTASVSDGAGLWIVNGPELNPAAMGGFTNTIKLTKCLVNVGPASYGIVDDGGYAHTFDSCTFNGGITAVRAAGAAGLHIVNAYAESQSDDIVVLSSFKLAGGGTGGGSAIIEGGQFSRAGGKAAFRGDGGPGALTVIGGSYNGSAPALANTWLFWSVSLIAPNLAGYPVYPFCDGTAPGAHFESSRIRAGVDGKVGVPNSAGATGGATLTPGTGSGYLETFNSAGARQGYGFLLNGSTLQFAAEGAATSFQFLDPVSSTGSITSTGGGIGYAQGAGGAITQPTSKVTAVTLNKLSGQITLAGTALAGATTASFKLNNNKIAAGDLLVLNHVSGGTFGSYALNAHGSAAGSVMIDVTNVSGSSLAEGVVIGFAIIKGVTS